MALTGLMTVVGSTLVSNQGLAINANLLAAVDTFNTENISGAVQTLINDLTGNLKTEIVDTLKSAPDFMTGLVPDGIELDSNITNVVQSVVDQANTVFPNIPNFISVYDRANNFAVEIFNFKGTVAAAQNTKFEDVGFQFKNYTDIASGGVTSQFKTEHLKSLAAEFSNLGSLFPTKDLYNFGTINSVAQSILDQGLGYVDGFETKIKTSNINLKEMSESDTEILNNLFRNIKGSSLSEIFATTEFKPANLNDIKTLYDIFNLKNVFSTKALSALEENDTFSELANKLSNVGGKFKDAQSLGEFYSNLNVDSYTSLNSFDTLLPSSMSGTLNSVGGTGTGFFGNPTLIDMLGSVSGIGYTDDIKFINDLQVELLSSDVDILEFKNYLESGNVVVNELTSKIESFINKGELTNKIQEGERRLRNIADRLRIELSNIIESKILIDLQPANSVEILKFAGQLHAYSNDPMKLGTADLLNSIVTSDSHGDSIRACLAEGRNLATLSAAGINPGTKISAMDYARKLSK